MSSAPTGWLVCNGAEYAIADYGDLHAAIGTTWGALTNGSGSAGSTHFRVPDLRGAFLRGTGSHGSSTMANSSAFAGASVGSFENDQFQGFQVGGESSGTRYGIVQGGLGLETATSASNTNYGYSDYNLAFKGYSNMLTAVADNTNGAPRKGTETKPFNAGINYCIKY
jgi:microcystin-dependent protein